MKAPPSPFSEGTGTAANCDATSGPAASSAACIQLP